MVNSIPFYTDQFLDNKFFLNAQERNLIGQLNDSLMCAQNALISLVYNNWLDLLIIKPKITIKVKLAKLKKKIFLSKKKNNNRKQSHLFWTFGYLWLDL